MGEPKLLEFDRPREGDHHAEDALGQQRCEQSLELHVELLQPPQHLLDHLLLWEYGRTEVVGPRLLPKAGARDDADAGGFQEMGCVEDVSWLAGFLGSL